MEPEDIKRKLTEVFKDIFNAPSIEIHENMTAGDVDGWDSLTHINLIVAVEKKFKVNFTTKEIGALNNVGGLLALITKKL